jgi:ribonuclease-3
MVTNYLTDGFKIINNNGEEEIFQIPYNLNNVLPTEEDIIQILSNFNVKVKKINHINFFYEAFTHKSYCKKEIFNEDILEASKREMGNPNNLLELQERSYERLEYFGDRVIKIIVSFYLFKRYPNQDEGFMTRLQTKIEDKTNLAEMSKEIGLGKFFIISKQIETMNGRNLDKIHEDVFEAFMGALFNSNGFEPCFYLMINLLETMIHYSEKLYKDNNYKDRLLRYYHVKKWKFPSYCTIYSEGPPHKRTYIMGVEKPDYSLDDHFKDKCIGFGLGTSKKEGEQAAAKMALINYGVLKEDQYTKADLYYPNWSLIDNNNGKLILNNNDDDNDDNNNDNNNDNDNDDDEDEDNSSVYSNFSKKSLEL